MYTKFLLRAAFAASILSLSAAQASVPKDLTSGFQDSGVELQVSFTGEATEGFKDGSTFSKDQTSKEPTFALGDSSGISTTTLFTVLMVDTTDDKARTLHYARANFKAGSIVNIESEDTPLLEYKAPGAFGETGDARKYTFLLYKNPQRNRITTLKLPDQGKAFDVKKFQSDNGLPDPAAGLGMTVNLGGGSGSGGNAPSSSSSSSAAAGGQSTSAAAAPPSSPSTSSAAAPSSSAASSSTRPATSAAGGASPSSNPAPRPSAPANRPDGSGPENPQQPPSTLQTSSLAPSPSSSPSAPDAAPQPPQQDGGANAPQSPPEQGGGASPSSPASPAAPGSAPPATTTTPGTSPALQSASSASSLAFGSTWCVGVLLALAACL